MVKHRMSVHPTVRKMFAGRRIVVASMHGKHHVMRPLLRQYLSIDMVVIPDLDTDQFGTFSGEIERAFDPVTTLRKKILTGLKISGETLAIGNEGSFAPHPYLPFLHVNQELVMMIDLKNDIEIMESVVSTDTVHAQMEITSMKDLVDFANKVKFPSHGIILKQLKADNLMGVRKGILNWEVLDAAFRQYHTKEATLIAETDMRGYMNPTRMKVIERATELLMKKITCLCPECQWPGFGVVQVREGLPCSQCNAPTKLTLLKIYYCERCCYTDERYYADVHKADPQYCDHCNP